MTQFKSINAVTANANGAELVVDPNKVIPVVGLSTRSSNYGSGTVKLQAQLPDSTTWFDVPSATRTADGYVASTNVVANKLRAVLTGATTPAALSAWITVDEDVVASVTTNN